MTRFNKSNLAVNGNRMNVSMPFSKVDKENRLVHGWATMDNLDSQDDVVLAAASSKAFTRARGNIREMHGNDAVGKTVDFREQEFYDPESGNFYNGIFVTAYVSKGAPNTWEKVLDGTLTGFSIGGEIRDASNDFDKAAGKSVRIIKDYDLVELSLVDNPANQLANINSFEKSVVSFNQDSTGSVIAKGMAVDTKIENVFICDKHEDSFVVASEDETMNCAECDSAMKNIGWFETDENRGDKVDEIVSKFKSPDDSGEAPTNEGGVTMSKSDEQSPREDAKEVGVVNPSEEFHGQKVEESDEVSVPVDETAGTDEGEEAPAVTPEEATDDASEISKKMDELHEAVTKSLSKSQEETLEKVNELQKDIEKSRSDWAEEFKAFTDKFDGLNEKIETQKAELADLKKNFSKMNDSEAMRKSAGVQTPAEPVQKESFWGNAFSA